MVFGFCSNPLNFNQTISERTTKTHQKQWNLLAFKNTTHTKYPFISRDCEVGQLDDLSEERRTFVAKVPQSQRCLLHVLLLKPHKTSAIMWLRPVHHLPFLLYPPTHTPAPTCQCCTHTGLHSHWTLALQQCSHCVFFLRCDHDPAWFRLHTTSNTSSSTGSSERTLQLISVCLLENGTHQCKPPKLMPT